MQPFLRIATWNLRRPRQGGWKYNQAIQNQIRSVNADVWVLTETNACIPPGDEYECIASPGLPGYSFGENCSTIWSRYPIRQLETQESEVSACVKVDTPIGNLIVYGTIITWANDGVYEKQSKKWERHYEAIAFQSQDWLKLEETALPICVAGDFNEALSEPFHYGTKKGKALLESALKQTDLVCVTAQKTFGYNIDHICLTSAWAERVTQINFWNCSTADGKPVSDHRGVSVDLSLN